MRFDGPLEPYPAPLSGLEPGALVEAFSAPKVGATVTVEVKTRYPAGETSVPLSGVRSPCLFTVWKKLRRSIEKRH